MTHVLHQLKRGRTYGLYVFSQKMCNDINDVYKKYIYCRDKAKTNVHTPIDHNNIWLHLITEINNNLPMSGKKPRTN